MFARHQHTRTQHRYEQQDVELLMVVFLLLEITMREDRYHEGSRQEQAYIEECVPVDDKKRRNLPRSDRRRYENSDKGQCQPGEGQNGSKPVIAAESDGQQQHYCARNHYHKRQDRNQIAGGHGRSPS